MYKGDRSRKETLVEYGFRLPSALDNRPLKFEEWEQLAPQMIFVVGDAGQATKRDTRRRPSSSCCGPTHLVDPEVEVRPVATQVDDVLSEIHLRVAQDERVLITTLTKRMSEDLTEYLHEHGVKVRYLHSDVETVERMEIIRDLRLGKFDVLVGINLLREGLDMPEVSLVAILDADKEGFLRSDNSLIQTMGRAARHVNGKRDPVCRPHHRLDAARDGGDRSPPRHAARVQQGARHHAAAASARTCRTSWKVRAPIPRTSATRWARRSAAREEAAPNLRMLSPEQIVREIKRLEARDVQARAQSRVRRGRATARRHREDEAAGAGAGGAR